MNYNELKEHKKHGDNMMPIKCYSIKTPAGVSPMHCHWHNELEIFKVSEGQMSLQCGNNHYSGKQGDTFFFNSGQLHAAESDSSEPSAFKSIVFHPDLICDSDIIRAKYITPLLTGNILIPTELKKNDEADRIFERIFHIMSHETFGYEMEVKGLIMYLMSIMLKNAETCSVNSSGCGGTAGIKKTIAYINKNYSQPLTISELSSMCDMSEGHFCRLFKHITMKTPVQYINNVRVTKAVEMLTSSDKKVLDIAMDTGFNSLSYFIGVFKDNLGITPTKFRKEYNKNSSNNS